MARAWGTLSLVNGLWADTQDCPFWRVIGKYIAGTIKHTTCPSSSSIEMYPKTNMKRFMPKDKFKIYLCIFIKALLKGRQGTLGKGRCSLWEQKAWGLGKEPHSCCQVLDTVGRRSRVFVTPDGQVSGAGLRLVTSGLNRERLA